MWRGRRRAGARCSARRDDLVIATKFGMAMDNYHATPPAIADARLRRR